LYLTGLLLLPAAAQGPPAAPVSYTEARSYNVRPSVRLPGTVEARTESPVAAEVEGLVVEIINREGAAVDKDTPLVKLRTTNLEISRRATAAEIKEAQARYERAQRVMNRASELFDDDAISQNEFDDARAEFLSREGQLEKLNADLDRIDLDIERSTIRSPVKGVVVARHCDLGSWVRMGDSIMDVLATQTLEVRVEVPDRYFSELHVGETVQVTLDIQPPKTLEGKISAVIPKADNRSRVFPIKVSVQGSKVAVAGMIANVAVQVGQPQPSLIVPKDALVNQGPVTVVYVLNDDGTAKSVTVTPGQGAGAWVAVGGDLAAGDKVIVRGNERVFPGQVFKGEPLEYDLP